MFTLEQRDYRLIPSRRFYLQLGYQRLGCTVPPPDRKVTGMMHRVAIDFDHYLISVQGAALSKSSWEDEYITIRSVSRSTRRDLESNRFVSSPSLRNHS